MSQSSSDTLPAFFPLTRKECEAVSAEFFKCLSENSNPVGSSEAGAAAVKACRVQQEKYVKCTRASLDAKGAKKPIVLTEWETD